MGTYSDRTIITNISGSSTFSRTEDEVEVELITRDRKETKQETEDDFTRVERFKHDIETDNETKTHDDLEPKTTDTKTYIETEHDKTITQERNNEGGGGGVPIG